MKLKKLLKHFLSSNVDKHTFITTWKFRLECRLLRVPCQKLEVYKEQVPCPWPPASFFVQLLPSSNLKSKVYPQPCSMYFPLVAMYHLEISREVPGRCSVRWPGLFGQKTLESWISGTHETSGVGMLWTECLCSPKTHMLKFQPLALLYL